MSGEPRKPAGNGNLVAALRQARPVAPADLGPPSIGPLGVARDKSRSGYAVTVRPVLGFEPDLPWSVRDDDDGGRFRRLQIAFLVVFLVIAAVLLFYKPPPPDRTEAEKISPRLAKLVLERKEQPKPEPIKVEKKPEEKKADEKKPEEKKAEDTPKPEAKKDLPPPKKPLDKEVAEARERASKTGLVAMRDQLAALRDLSNTDSLRQEQTKVGAAGTERAAERDLIGKAATSGSGGVATKQIAHAGGGTLAGRSTERVSGPAGAPSIADAEREARGTKRTAEEIKLAFDANKSAIYGIYRRALRANPLLEGRVVLKLTIAPSGDVTACSIVSSALNDKDLEEKLVARVQLINFGTRPKLEAWTGNYHIDFVPSG